MRPSQIPDLAGLWTFQEDHSPDRCTGRACGSPPLTPVNGPIERVSDALAPFGGRAARIRPGQWFALPRAGLGALDIHGPCAQVSVVAWLLRETSSPWQAIAGVWDETRCKRQYFLFLNASTLSNDTTLQRVPCSDRVHGHISRVGGPTPGHEYCVTYATGSTRVPLNQWVCVAMTYDGAHIRTFVNGRLDGEPHSNPFSSPGGISDGGGDGADFTVGANSAGGQMTNFFGGLLGGLAVYRRALTSDELHSLTAPA